MVSLLIEMIVENFMFVMVEHNRFAGVKKECYGMKSKSDVACKMLHLVSMVERNGDEMKVNEHRCQRMNFSFRQKEKFMSRSDLNNNNNNNISIKN